MDSRSEVKVQKTTEQLSRTSDDIEKMIVEVRNATSFGQEHLVNIVN